MRPSGAPTVLSRAFTICHTGCIPRDCGSSGWWPPSKDCSPTSPRSARATFTHENVPAAIPPDLTLCLFRIAQEALQNALKHSQAENVSVHLSGNSHSLTLTVADDGVGFVVDEVWGRGLGLVSMGERVDAFGGTFTVQSSPRGGTRLEANVPLEVTNNTSALVN